MVEFTKAIDVRKIFSRDYTDFCKLVSCILVVAAHYCQYLIYGGSNSAVVKAICAQSGKVGVAIFFLLSGYGVMSSYAKKPFNFGTFFKARVLKIYLPAVLSCLLLYIANYLINKEIQLDGGVVFA